MLCLEDPVSGGNVQSWGGGASIFFLIPCELLRLQCFHLPFDVSVSSVYQPSTVNDRTSSPQPHWESR